MGFTFVFPHVLTKYVSSLLLLVTATSGLFSKEKVKLSISLKDNFLGVPQEPGSKVVVIL